MVSSYKYLGVWVDQKLSSQKHLDFLFGVKKKEEDGRLGKKGKINFLKKMSGPLF